jgi:Immunity protein Imm1
LRKELRSKVAEHDARREMANVVLMYAGNGTPDGFERPCDWPALLASMEDLRVRCTAYQGMPFSVDLAKDNGMLEDDPSIADRLSVGMGNGEWMICYFPGQSGGSNLYSLGDPEAQGTVTFYFGDHSLVSRKHLIPKEVALKVARQWFERGTLSDEITWTDKMFKV